MACSVPICSLGRRMLSILLFGVLYHISIVAWNWITKAQQVCVWVSVCIEPKADGVCACAWMDWMGTQMVFMERQIFKRNKIVHTYQSLVRSLVCHPVVDVFCSLSVCLSCSRSSFLSLEIHAPNSKTFHHVLLFTKRMPKTNKTNEMGKKDKNPVGKHTASAHICLVGICWTRATCTLLLTLLHSFSHSFGSHTQRAHFLFHSTCAHAALRCTLFLYALALHTAQHSTA